MLSVLKMSDSLLKSIKSRRKDDFKDQFPLYVPKPKHPLPFVRKSLPNDDKMRKRLRIRGDKYFSKLAASGPETVTILKKLQGSQVKYIRNFEFDPYLCDSSGLKPLAKVFRKLKMIDSLNLVIRRVDVKGESSCLAPFLSRLAPLEKLRIEFPSTPNFHDEDMFYLIPGFIKCHNLRHFESHIISLPNGTIKTLGAPLFSLKGMPKLEVLSLNMLNKDTAFDDQKPEAESNSKNFSFPKLPKLKKFRMSVGRSSSEWVELKKETDQYSKHFIRSFSKAMNPQEFSLKTNGAGQRDEEMGKIMIETLSDMTNLRHLSYEFLNTNHSDLDIMDIMSELKELSQIERFTLKIIQHPNISEEIIHPFVSYLSKLENIKKCDLYFRRLNVPAEEVKELANHLQKIEKVNCSASQQSLYVWWDKLKR